MFHRHPPFDSCTSLLQPTQPANLIVSRLLRFLRRTSARTAQMMWRQHSDLADYSLREFGSRAGRRAKMESQPAQGAQGRQLVNSAGQLVARAWRFLKGDAAERPFVAAPLSIGGRGAGSSVDDAYG